MAGINDKQRVNALNSNAAWLAKNGDDATIGILSLENNDVASGDHVDNLQKAINKIYEGLGTTGENDTNINAYASNNYILDGDDRKEAIEKLDAQIKENTDDIVALGAGVLSNVTSVTSTYTALVTDKVILASGGAFDVTLYAATGNNGKDLTIQKTDSSKTNIITIKDSGGTILYVLRLETQFVKLVCNGTSFTLLDRGLTKSLSASYRCTVNKVSSPTAPIDFDGSEFDPFSIVTTGASWKVTAHIEGKYQINTVGLISSSASSIRIYKNGTFYKLLAYQPSAGAATGSTIIDLAYNDYFDLRTSGSLTMTGGSLGSDNVSHVSVSWLGF